MESTLRKPDREQKKKKEKPEKEYCWFICVQKFGHFGY
jgi:hypothetical protein